MTKTQFKNWLADRLAELEPTIGRPASVAEAALIAECKQYAYSLGLHDLAYTLPDTERVKTPLTAANQLKRCLAALEAPTERNGDSEYLTAKQAGEVANLSERQIYRLCSCGELTHARVGRAIRIKQSDLESYLASLENLLR
jgi:excisionase family DNA binding protein